MPDKTVCLKIKLIYPSLDNREIFSSPMQSEEADRVAYSLLLANSNDGDSTFYMVNIPGGYELINLNQLVSLQVFVVPHPFYRPATAQELKEITAFFFGMRHLGKDAMPTVISKYPNINPNSIQSLYMDFIETLCSKHEHSKT